MTRFVNFQVVPGLRPRFGLATTTSPRQRVSPDSNNPGQEAFERTTSNEYRNSLRVLEQSMEAWCCDWTLCKSFDVTKRAEYRASYRASGTRELDSADFRGQADRSGTSYVIGWRVRVIRREHPQPRAAKLRAGDPHSLQGTGLCYRGDFSDHLFFRHMNRLTNRAQNRRDSWRRIVEWLKASMSRSIAHFFGSHHYHNSFQRERMGDETDDHPSNHCEPCTDVISLYQDLADTTLRTGYSSKRLKGAVCNNLSPNSWSMARRELSPTISPMRILTGQRREKLAAGRRMSSII